MALAIATLVRLPHLWFVPIWDGRAYWDDCLQPALNKAFDPLAFNCFGHRSMLYMLTVSWPQYFSRDSVLLLNLAHLGISLLTIWAFYRVMVSLFPPAPSARSSQLSGRTTEAGDTGRIAGLATVLFASMPIWTGSSLNLNPDTGVLAAFLFALAFLLERRLVLATIAGLFLVLSKEIGLLLWLVLIGIEGGLAMHENRWRGAGRILLRRAGLLLPIVAYAGVGALLTAKALPANWAPQSRWALIKTFLTLDLSAPVFAAYVADLFLLNFAWVMTFVIAVWLVAICVSVFRRRPLPLPDGIDRRSGIVTALAALASVYLLTRYPTFNNPRYLLPAFPMVVIAFTAATVALVRRPLLRVAVLVVAAVLQLASMSRTIDPVSGFAFGTFRFGEHEMLAMTSRTGECCGFGRDQLVYNLQFTAFHDLQDQLFSQIRPGNGDVIGLSRAANWYLVGPLDAQTRQRTLRKNDVVRPPLLTLVDVAAGTMKLPERMHFVAYPNVDNRADLKKLATGYRVAGPFHVDEDGYRLAYYQLSRLHRSSPAPSAR